MFCNVRIADWAMSIFHIRFLLAALVAFDSYLCLSHHSSQRQKASRNGLSRDRNAPRPSPNGLVDFTCVEKMSLVSAEFGRCLEPLKESRQKEGAGLQICCSSRDFQGCILPLVLGECGMAAVDRLEEEMRSLNRLCDLVTDRYKQCPKKAPSDDDINASLTE